MVWVLASIVVSIMVMILIMISLVVSIVLVSDLIAVVVSIAMVTIAVVSMAASDVVSIILLLVAVLPLVLVVVLVPTATIRPGQWLAPHRGHLHPLDKRENVLRAPCRDPRAQFDRLGESSGSHAVPPRASADGNRTVRRDNRRDPHEPC